MEAGPGRAGNRGRPHAVTLGRLRSLAEQLGNVGTEVARAMRAKAQGNDERLTFALARALELFDFILGDERWRGLGAVSARSARSRGRRGLRSARSADLGSPCAPGLIRPIFAWTVAHDRARHRPVDVVHAQIATKPDPGTYNGPPVGHLIGHKSPSATALPSLPRRLPCQVSLDPPR